MDSFTIAVRSATVVRSSENASRSLSNQAQFHSSAGTLPPSPETVIKAASGSSRRVDYTEPPQAAALDTHRPTPTPPPGDERVQLTIDSLQNYDLLKPIPVVLESLGDKIYTAEAPDLDLSTSDNTLGGALLLLKDQITTVYEEYRMKKTMNPEQSRRFERLQTYIGKTKRNWR
jgi:hypothetical protein